MHDCLFISHPQPRDSGDYRHRVTLPGQALAKHLSVAEIQTSHPAWLTHALHAGLIVVEMVADAAVLSLLEARRALGRPSIFEISDDFRDFPENLPLTAFYRVHRNQALIEECARRADLLQFSSHGLATKYGHLNAQHIVFGNQLTDVPALPALPDCRHSEPALGWAGSSGHLEDARQLAAWLRPWYAARRDARRYVPPLRVMTSDRVASVFLDAGLPVSVHPPGSFESYLAFLAELDIGLAILGDTDFARGRSDGKFLEYASRGAVCVASASGEYLHGIHHGDTGLLFEGPSELGEHLTALVDDPGLRLRLRQAAYTHVSQVRTHEAAAIHRAAAYQHLLDRSRIEATTEPGNHRGMEASLVTLCESAEAHFVAASSRHMSGLVQQALDGYLSILTAHPGFHEPWARTALIARQLGADRDAELFEGMAARALHEQLGANTLLASA